MRTADHAFPLAPLPYPGLRRAVNGGSVPDGIVQVHGEHGLVEDPLRLLV